MTRIFNKGLLYPEISYSLTGIFFRIHKKLGRFCTERQYCDEIEKALQANNYFYKREKEISQFQKIAPKGNRVDFVIENKIIIEVKAKNFVTKEDYIQTIRYLESANLGLAMIVNFRNSYLKPKRVINSKFKYSGNSGDNSSYSSRF